MLDSKTRQYYEVKPDYAYYYSGKKQETLALSAVFQLWRYVTISREHNLVSYPGEKELILPKYPVVDAVLFTFQIKVRQEHSTIYYRVDFDIREEGRLEGAQQKAIETANNLYANGVSIEIIAKSLGMTEEQIESLRERMKKGQPSISEHSGGFGLVNVNLRIRLYYNQVDGLMITSDAGGTEVSFKVPCRTREGILEHESISG